MDDVGDPLVSRRGEEGALEESSQHGGTQKVDLRDAAHALDVRWLKARLTGRDCR